MRARLGPHVAPRPRRAPARRRRGHHPTHAAVLATAHRRGLAVPPAWRGLWLNPDPDARLQATGYDARGRKQYLYHPRWRARREAAKFARLVDFGRALPRIRRRVARDLRRAGLPRDRVLALVVRLIDATGVRVGNPEYARANHSYGLTTLLNRHARVQGSHLRLRFRGKSGRLQEIEVHDARLAHLVAACRALPAAHLFVHPEDGRLRRITSRDVNDYIRRAARAPFTAKDFRTWHATVFAANALRAASDGSAPPRRRIVAAVQATARHLGNTPAVCRRSYIHPAVLRPPLDEAPARGAPPLPRRERWVWARLARG